MKRHITFFFVTISFLFISCSESNEQTTAGQAGKRVRQGRQVVQSAAPVMVGASTQVRDENDWYHDWDAGMAAAREQNRPILVDFYTDWCKWCTVMDEETFSDPAIKQKFAEDWIMIKINAEDKVKQGTFKGKTMTYRELTQAFGVQGYPSYVFIDNNGEPANIVSGYREKEPFAAILDYFRDEVYKLDDESQKKYMESHMSG